MIPLETIRRAAETIRGQILRTPMIQSPSLSETFSADIRLKLENLQITGSFKIRGAAYKLSVNRGAIGPKGVVAASAGNHAQGVALAARKAGVPAVIVMPEWVSISKQEATRNYGGEVEIHGNSIAECLRRAEAHVRKGRTLIHPFDDPDIVAGQGTIGLEIADELPDVDVVLAPVGGGGLISGIASALKAVRPRVKIIGVEAASCPSASESRRKGKRVLVASEGSIADGISVKQIGALNFEIMQACVDEIVTVDEEHIAAAMLLLLERKKILAEGSGAVPLAALLQGSVSVKPDSRLVLVVSGGNVDPPLLGRILAKGLIKNGRIMRIRVKLEDIPGALAGLLAAVARLKANVLHIYHDRHTRDVPIYVTRVELELETRGPEHVAEIVDTLRHQGYAVSLR
ncbi:MAG: threonine ammonia-lyase [Desulfobacterales bacterium]|jgi:threonine dehydratase